VPATTPDKATIDLPMILTPSLEYAKGEDVAFAYRLVDPDAATPSSAVSVLPFEGYGTAVEVRPRILDVGDTFCSESSSAAESVLLGGIPVTESPSAGLLLSPV